jgi:nondiscriminating glutamyl-tRNA synthetase
VAKLLPAVRVRIAPSPTGNLHVGTARTALFNYLFAKRHQGQFVLRIEDTDLERSQPQYTQNIYDGLKALGLSWDEGPDCGGPYAPYAQSERLDLYQAWAQKLLDADKAYLCYLTPEELDAEREAATQASKPYVHSGRCRDPQVRAELAKDPTRKPSVRFKVPVGMGPVTFDDAVRGHLSFDSHLIGDFVIMKSNGTPSYNFAVVVDDLTMAITHVIRGEDHISNTAKQVMLYQAYEQAPPVFAHVSMILSPDRSKLSKRHGATAVSDYIYEQGYLPQAFCNFLALLGWSPENGEEIASLDAIAQQFDLGRLAHSGAIFDKDKLNWVNSQYLRALPLPTLVQLATPYLTQAGYNVSRYTPEQQAQMLGLVIEPVHTLSELPEAVAFFFTPPYLGPDSPAEVQDTLAQPEAASILAAFQADVLPQLAADAEGVAAQLKAFCNSLKPLKTKAIMWTIRATLTGRVHGADLSTTMALLGAPELQQRIANQQKQLAAVSP